MQNNALENKSKEAIFIHLPGLVTLLAGEEGHCSFIHPSFEKSWGGHELIGQPMEQAWPGLSRSGWFEMVKKVYASGESIYTYEQPGFSGLKSDTTKEEYFNQIFSPFYSEDGAIEGVLFFQFDITAKVLAQKKLAQDLAYRSAILEAHNKVSHDGLLLVDAAGKIISYNPKFVELWNMPEEIVKNGDDTAALEFAMSQLVDPQQFIDKVMHLYAHPTETSIDELELKNGKILERKGYPVIGEDKTYYAWSWSFKDITS
jgi:hypothetical protein